MIDQFLSPTPKILAKEENFPLFSSLIVRNEIHDLTVSLLYPENVSQGVEFLPIFQPDSGKGNQRFNSFSLLP